MSKINETIKLKKNQLFFNHNIRNSLNINQTEL